MRRTASVSRRSLGSLDMVASLFRRRVLEVVQLGEVERDERVRHRSVDSNVAPVAIHAFVSRHLPVGVQRREFDEPPRFAVEHPEPHLSVDCQDGDAPCLP